MANPTPEQYKAQLTSLSEQLQRTGDTANAGLVAEVAAELD